MWVGKGLGEFEGAAAAKTKQYKTKIWNNNKYNKSTTKTLESFEPRVLDSISNVFHRREADMQKA